MSYSFNVRAATKAEARAEVEAKFDAEVIKHQPSHARDKAQALANLDNALALLADDDTKDVSISMSGALSLTNWQDQENCEIVGVTINCSLGYVSRPAA